MSPNLLLPLLPRLSKERPPLFLLPVASLPGSALKFGSINLWIAFHLDLSSPPTKLNAEPSAPALAVLPILCIKSSGTWGKSKLITCLMAGISKPLLATSVPTKILKWLFLKALITLSLLFCLKFPCIASASCESYLSLLTIFSAFRLVLTKIKIDPWRL